MDLGWDSEFVQIAAVFEEAWAPEYTYIGVIVDTDTIQKLQVSPLAYMI
jgi:hypothetical protein